MLPEGQDGSPPTVTWKGEKSPFESSEEVIEIGRAF